MLDEASGENLSSVFGDGAKELLIAHRVYLGFVQGVAVGCVMASVSPGSAIIHGLAVSRAHRNRGHATTLVKSAMAHLDDPASLTYWAAADPSNPSAVKRFHLLGFETHGPGTSDGLILMLREAGAPDRSRRAARPAAEGGRIPRTPTAGATKASASND